jgi:hypothetical protein
LIYCRKMRWKQFGNMSSCSIDYVRGMHGMA